MVVSRSHWIWSFAFGFSLATVFGVSAFQAYPDTNVSPHVWEAMAPGILVAQALYPMFGVLRSTHLLWSAIFVANGLAYSCLTLLVIELTAMLVRRFRSTIG